MHFNYYVSISKIKHYILGKYLEKSEHSLHTL